MRSPAASSVSHDKVGAVKHLYNLTVCQTVFGKLLLIIFINQKFKNLTWRHLTVPTTIYYDVYIRHTR